MNYLVLVNKNNLIKESYFKDLELVECKNDDGDIIKVEKETYSAYLELKKYLDSINIDVVIGSAFRSIEEQQKIIDDFTKEHGEEYVKNYVAPIRTSEHHTGLALDLVLLVEEDENLAEGDLPLKERLYREIHKHLSDYGFILRYPVGKESITGYNYEPWHIRYVGRKAADYIYHNDLTLEEYVKMERF